MRSYRGAGRQGQGLVLRDNRCRPGWVRARNLHMRVGLCEFRLSGPADQGIDVHIRRLDRGLPGEFEPPDIAICGCQAFRLAPVKAPPQITQADRASPVARGIFVPAFRIGKHRDNRPVAVTLSPNAIVDGFFGKSLVGAAFRNDVGLDKGRHLNVRIGPPDFARGKAGGRCQACHRKEEKITASFPPSLSTSTIPFPGQDRYWPPRDRTSVAGSRPVALCPDRTPSSRPRPPR